MNYRHSFHAGNFADVLKHVVLCRIITYLQRKDGAYRVIDTHAGIGRYRLTTGEAARTGEWLDGIGRLRDAKFSGEVQALLQPYLDCVLPGVVSDTPSYPGSPLIARMMARKQDRLTAIELHPQDADTLRQLFAGDHQVRVIHLDGWLALGAHLPPKEKRGMVLIDPPFEEQGDFARMVDGMTRAHRRWPGGTYALWYPVKDHKAVQSYRKLLSASGVPDIIDIELLVRDTGGARLDGCGMTIVNPPWTLQAELERILPELTAILAQDPLAASGRITRLAQERVGG